MRGYPPLLIALLVVSGTSVLSAQHRPGEPAREFRPHAAPSFSRFVHSTGAYAIELPADWAAHENGDRVNIGPDDGLVRTQRGFRTIYGVIVAITPDPLAGRPERSLIASAAATVDAVLKRNPHQSLSISAHEDGTLAGTSAVSAVLTGISPVTGRGERAEIVCRRYGDTRLMYLILVSPADYHDTLHPTLVRIRESLRVLQQR